MGSQRYALYPFDSGKIGGQTVELDEDLGALPAIPLERYLVETLGVYVLNPS